MSKIICENYEGKEWYFEVEENTVYCKYNNLPKGLNDRLRNKGFEIVHKEVDYPVYIEVQVERTSNFEELEKRIEQKTAIPGYKFAEELASESILSTHKYKITEDNEVELFAVDGEKIN